MKPVAQITRLYQALSSPDRIRQASIESVLPFRPLQDPACLLLHRGSLGLFRRQGRMLMGILQAPDVVGMTGLLTEVDAALTPPLYLQSLSPVEYELIPYQQVHQALTERDLWPELASIQSYLLLNATQLYLQFAGNGSDARVIQALLLFLRLPEALRQQTQLVDYVHERTKLSRSGIMAIFKRLREDGHIEIRNGYLYRINSLPGIDNSLLNVPGWTPPDVT